MVVIEMDKRKFLKVLFFFFPSLMLVRDIDTVKHILSLSLFPVSSLYSRQSYFQSLLQLFSSTLHCLDRTKNQIFWNPNFHLNLHFSVPLFLLHKLTPREKKMSEFSLESFPSSPKKKTHDFSSIILSDFFLFCSFIFSHPLYFSYFIFFSPYLFKLFSFLSPLFITTSLLLLALLTISPGLLPDNETYQNVLDKIRSGAGSDSVQNDVFEHFEELEVYKIVFEVSAFDVRAHPDEVLEVKAVEACVQAFEEEPVDKCVIDGVFSVGVSEALAGNHAEAKPTEVSWPEIGELIEGGKESEGFLKGKGDGVENLPWKIEEIQEKEVKEVSVESNKVVEQPSMRRSGSKAIGNRISEAKVSTPTTKAMVNSQSLGTHLESIDNGGGDHQHTTSKVLDSYPNFDSTLGSFGSMRKEKEWKRTLACKLFEERHNAEGGGAEGMDMLWETYEAESTKVQVQLKNTKNKGNKGSVESYEDDEDEEDDVRGQLCCLQALKFSAGKMNLGMGRPNLVRISKALKGIGWLHHVSKPGKKVYH